MPENESMSKMSNELCRLECLSLILKNSHDLALDQIIEAAVRFENYIRNGGENQSVDQDVKATTRFDHYIKEVTVNARRQIDT